MSKLIWLTKGCFLGQETLSKLSNKGFFKKQLRLVDSSDEFSVGDKLFSRNLTSKKLDYAGYITSSLKDSSENNIGLAVIKNRFLEEKTLIINESTNLVKLNKPIGFYWYSYAN